MANKRTAWVSDFTRELLEEMKRMIEKGNTEIHSKIDELSNKITAVAKEADKKIAIQDAQISVLKQQQDETLERLIDL